jgi:hypothetical protein
MKAGRELDAKVAEALTGDDVEFIGGKLMWFPDQEGAMQEVPHFSTTWEGMGMLVEEARKQGILIDIETTEAKYKARVFRWNDIELKYDEIATVEGNSAPHIVCDAFLWGKGTER